MGTYGFFVLGILSAPASAGQQASLGVSVNRVGKITYQYLGLRTASRVVAVSSDCSTDGVLHKGDLVVEVDGTPIDSASALAGVLHERAPGDQLSIVFYHDGERREAVVVAGRRAINGCEKVPVRAASVHPVAPPPPPTPEVADPIATPPQVAPVPTTTVAPSAHPSVPSSSPQGATDFVTQLERLQGLYDEGVLTEAEFNAAKARALGAK